MFSEPAEWLTGILFHDFISLKELSLREMNFDAMSESVQNKLEGLVRSESLHRLKLHSVQFPRLLLYDTKGLKHLTMINTTFLDASSTSSTSNELKAKPPVLHTLTIYADRGVGLSKLMGLSIRSDPLRSNMFQKDELNQILEQCRATLKHIGFNASFEVDETLDIHFERLEALTTLHIHFPIIRDDLLLCFKCNSDIKSIKRLNWKDFSSVINDTTGFLPSWHLKFVFCRDQTPSSIRLEFEDEEKTLIQQIKGHLPNFNKFASVQKGEVYGESYI
ncbi:hypothetical protein C0995_013180 [Termitomyces sp. Mi166|nr:hypothetical protein C0995_013180 [Termitomyces sp. Mi166\